jgi:signal transduction histidine kinase
LAIGSFTVFAMLTVGNVTSYRLLPHRDLRIYTLFTLFGALQALCVVLSLLPMTPFAKSQIFRLMWVFGSGGLGSWVVAVLTFVGAQSRPLQLCTRAFFAVAAIALLDFCVVAVSGSSAFYALDPKPTDAVVLLASGNVLRHLPLADALGAVAVLLAFTTSGLLVWTLLRSAHRDRWLMAGVIATPILFASEVAMAIAQSKYNLPVIFMANLIVAMRIMWASRERLVREVNEIRSARLEQAALLERQLEQIKLNERLVNVGKRTAELSHDMRNPLTAVVGTLDLAEGALRAEPPDVAEARELLSEMHMSIDHVLALVQRVTRQARSTAGTAEVIVLAEVVADAMALCRHRLHGLPTQIHVSEELLAWGQRTELTQVLVNLVSNACDALEGLSARWIMVEAKEENKRLQIRVSDAGRRPADAVLDKMFVTRFTSGTSAGATGLGLTICAQIVRQHEGQIFVDRKAANTTFVVDLPLPDTIKQRAA